MMDQPFRPRLEILPPAQRRLWDELGATPRHFTLYGGTALALRLGHRSSEDFDFFSRSPFDAGELQRGIPYLRGSQTVQFSPNTLTCIVDRDGAVKVSYFGDQDIQETLSEPDLADPGVAVASLEDVAATKLRTIQLRAALRDYVDIAALLDSGLSLASLIDWARRAYGASFNPILALKALSYFGDGDLTSLPGNVKDQLREAVRELS